MSYIVRWKCEGTLEHHDRHMIKVECWSYTGYYMLDELPQDNGWHWEVGTITREYEDGCIVSGVIVDRDDEVIRRPDGGMLEHRGRAPSREEAIRAARDLHASVCIHSLMPWQRRDEMTPYGWREQGGYEPSMFTGG